MDKRLRMAIAGGGLLLIAAAALLWQADGLAAAQLGDTRRLVVVDLVTLRDASDGKRRSVFQRGARMTAEVRIKDRRDADDGVVGDPDYERRYAVGIWVKDPDDGVIYDGTGSAAEMREIGLAPSKRGSVRFEWNVPYDAPDGRYTFYASVRYADNPGRVVHRFAQAFGVNERPTYIYTSKRGIDFGDVARDETPTGSLIIARRNRDAGDLVWRVVDWPRDWLELLEPAIDPDNADQSVEVVNTGTLRFGVRGSALRGSFRDEVVVSSNAGELTFDVSANINRRARGALERVRVQPKALDAGQDLRVEFRVANEGDAAVDYRVMFAVQGPDGAIMYHSNRAGDDVVMRLAAGERSEALTFRWQVPYGAYGGEYRVGLELRNAHEFNTAAFDAIRVYDDEDAEMFKVREGARIGVSPGEWRFGAITQGDDAARAVFGISNRGSARDALRWEVVGAPDWVEILGASSGVGEGELAVGVRDGIAPGRYGGALEIASNGGTAVVALGLAVRAGPTATATTILRATSTATGTATAVPTIAATGTSTAMPTIAPRIAPMGMATVTATGTSAVTPTAVRTATVTGIAAATATATVVPTVTAAAVRTATQTGMIAPTDMSTVTPTVVSTGAVTAVPSETATVFRMATQTAMATPSETATVTPMAVRTAVATVAPPGTVVAVPSAAATGTAAVTSTGTAASSVRGRVALTSTPMPLATVVPTSTAMPPGETSAGTVMPGAALTGTVTPTATLTGVTSAVLRRESGSRVWGCGGGDGRPLAGLVVLGLMLAPAGVGRILTQRRKGARGVRGFGRNGVRFAWGVTQRRARGDVLGARGRGGK